MQHLESHASFYYYEFNNAFTQLEFVYIQILPTWLIISIILFCSQKFYFYFITLLFIIAPFPGIGLGILLFIKMLLEIIQKKVKISEYITLENILIIVPLFLTFVFYYLSNKNNGRIFIHWSSKIYFLFILIKVGFYFILLFNKYKKNILYWSMLVIMLLVPIFPLSNSIDFCARASIPCSFILAILTSQYVVDNKGWRRDVLLLLLAIAMITPYAHFITKIRLSKNIPISSYQTNAITTLNQSFKDTSNPILESFPIKQYLSDNDALFYKYISK